MDFGELSGKKVLITGGLGFIGMNLTKKLLSLGAQVTLVNRSVNEQAMKSLKEFQGESHVRIFQGDIRDRSLLHDLLQDCDVVFNLAAKSGAAKSLMHAREDMWTNIDGHLNLLEVVRGLERKPRIVFTSSRLIYGVTGEASVDENSLPMPTSIYGLHKLTAEHYYRLYNQQHDVPTVILRVTNPYGPYQNPETKDYGIANRFIMNAVRGEPITIYGEGEQLRDYLYVDDAVDALLCASISEQAVGKAFNIGRGDSISLAELAREIDRVSGGCELSYVPWPEGDKKVETGDFKVDVSRAREILGWEAKTSLEQGLRESIEHYRSVLSDSTEPPKEISSEPSVAKVAAGKSAPTVFVMLDGFPVLSETFVLDQLVGLIERGFDVRIFALCSPNENVKHRAIDEYKLLERTTYIRIPPEQLLGNTYQWMQVFKELNPTVDFTQADVFHVHFGKMFNVLAPIFRVHDAFTLVSFYGYDASSYIRENPPGVYDELFQRANVISANTFTMRLVLLKEGALEDKVIVRRCGMDFSSITPPDRSTRDGKVRLLTVGRMVEKKGIDDAINAFSLLPNREQLEYRIFGHGRLFDEHKALIERLRLGDSISLSDSITRSEMYEELYQADVFILTSCTAPNGDQEGLPVVITEAMAAELPIISTHHAGIPEVVLDEQTGLIAPEKDVNRIAMNISRLSKDKDMRLRLGRNGRAKVLEEFNVDALNDSLAQLFLDGLKARNVSAA